MKSFLPVPGENYSRVSKTYRRREFVLSPIKRVQRSAAS